MGLSWRKDGVATALTAAAVALYVLYMTGTQVPGLSGTRVVTGAVLGLAFAACISGGADMTTLSGYVLLIPSLIGVAALVVGIIGIATTSEMMLTSLAAASFALWVIATMRHALAPRPRVDDAAIQALSEAAARQRVH